MKKSLFLGRPQALIVKYNFFREEISGIEVDREIQCPALFLITFKDLICLAV